jgi:hypothetical protein
MAGLDGIERELNPGEPIDRNLYELAPEQLADIPTVATTLDEALEALEADHDFLIRRGVFTDDLIATYIEFRREQSDRVKIRPHPYEFPMYFDGLATAPASGQPVEREPAASRARARRVASATQVLGMLPVKGPRRGETALPGRRWRLLGRSVGSQNDRIRRAPGKRGTYAPEVTPCPYLGGAARVNPLAALRGRC